MVTPGAWHVTAVLPIVDHEVLDPLELAHLDGSPTVNRDSQTGPAAEERRKFT